MDNCPDMTTLLFNDRRWRGRLLLPVGALLVCSIALALAVLARYRFADEVRVELARSKALQQSLLAGAGAAAPACSTEVAYAQALPPAISLDRLVQSLQDSAKAFDVTIRNVSGEPHAQTARTLASLEVDIALHGSYPGIKAALAESLARFPSGTLMRLRLKRDGAASPPTEDATAQVSFALRPLASTPLDCRLGASDLAKNETSR